TTVLEFLLRVPPKTPVGGPYTATITALEGGVTPLAEASFEFEVLTELPALELAAEPLNSPVTRGENLDLRISLANNTPSPFTGDLVLDVEHQGGLVASRTLRRDAVLPGWRAGAPT